MKASCLPRCALLFIVTLFVSNHGRAENGTTNPSAGTGEGTEKSTSLTTQAASASSLNPPAPTNRRVATLAVSDLREYETQSPEVKRLLARALSLTILDLTYQYGSSDPKNGGMDCSGTVYYLLNDAGLKDVPRDASEMYKWVWTRSCFQAVISSHPDTFELALLKPGDLLFWTGTYQVDHDPPVTHVMIYLGINRHSGQRVMVGASDGRLFEGKPRYGVSVFDFTLPGKNRPAGTDIQSRFIGYGSVPGLEEIDRSGESKP